MTTLARKSIADMFRAARENKKIALMPFIPAGYPDLQTTAKLLSALEQGGASMIEIGFPFSDPIADGPIIQEAFTQTLAKNFHLADLFSTIAQARPSVSIPLIAMVSHSIVYRTGIERFAQLAKTSGFDGVIIPDLPPPEAQSVCKIIRAAGLDTILLVAPTTSPARRKEIADLCSGFIYYLSITGITGERNQLPADLADNLNQLRALGPTPVCVGFGISTADHVRQMSGLADGAIVGSALVRRIKESIAQGSITIAQAAGDFCKKLLQP